MHDFTCLFNTLFLWFFYQYFLIRARQRGCIYSESESGFWDVPLLISTKHGQKSNQEDFRPFLYNVFPHHSSNYWSPGKTCSQAEALEGILRRGLSWVLQSKHHVSSRWWAHLVYLVQKCCHLESEFNKNGCKSLFLRSLKQTGLWVEVKRSWYISDF